MLIEQNLNSEGLNSNSEGLNKIWILAVYVLL